MRSFLMDEPRLKAFFFFYKCSSGAQHKHTPKSNVSNVIKVLLKNNIYT